MFELATALLCIILAVGIKFLVEGQEEIKGHLERLSAQIKKLAATEDDP